MRTRSALGVALIFLIGPAAMGCSPDNPFNQILSKAGVSCVDATGANSTAEQIADAQLNTPITDPRTGETKTGMETALEAGNEANSVLGLKEHSPEEIRQAGIEAVFTDVPDGGDAAFAGAVCDEVNVDLWDRLTATNGLTDDTLATTPHYLRGIGRTVCGSLGDTFAEAEFKELAAELDEAALDHDVYKEKQLLLLAENLKDAEELARENPKMFDLELMRQNRDEFAATPADDIVANLKSSLRMQWFAVEHQCPDKSRYGFGPDCGEFNPFPDGGVSGILKVREGHLSCEDAKTVVRWHYFPSQADDSSPLSLYRCEENGFEDIEEAPLYIECEAIQGNHDPAHIIVKPK